MKNYVGFVNDHSASMRDLANAAVKDYNANITATKDAASREMLDTVVSVVGFGFYNAEPVKRQVVISNPHVLKPLHDWPTSGNTQLYDGVANMIELFQSLPDANSPDVSFLVLTTTDGGENDSTKYNSAQLRGLITEKQNTGRWTFVFRVPRNSAHRLSEIGVPKDNIQEWDTSEAGMAASSVKTQEAMSNFYTMRSAGAKSSNTFYTDASKVNTAALVDISNKVSLYVVEGVGVENGIWIRDFVLKKRAQYLKGAGFYQLTKTEPRITEGKLVCVRDKATGKIYGGQQAREMVGLPKYGNARLHPGDHKNFDIFVQSESVNRKLVIGTGLLYWEEKGVPFTQAELDQFLSPFTAPLPPKPAVVQLPSVPVSYKPTKSPIPATKQVPAGPTVNGKPVLLFKHRSMARDYARSKGYVNSVIDLAGLLSIYAINCNDARWAVYL